MKNIRLFSFLTIVALLTLIIIRLKNHEESSWISCINYIGLVIALCGFLAEFSSRYTKNRLANFIKGVILIVISILIVLGCFIVTGRIDLTPLADDEILLFTLLISLPTNYYCELLDLVISKYNNEEYSHGTR